MALVAYVLPERWLPQLPEVAEHDLAVLQQNRARVLQLAREARPPDGSETERQILHEFMRLVFPMVNRVVPEFLDALRNGIHEGLRELIAKERGEADTERQLAIRHLEHAVNTFGVLIESWAAIFRSLPQASLHLMMDLVTKAALGSPLPPMPEEARVVLRFELDLMVAIECLDAPLDDLTSPTGLTRR